MENLTPKQVVEELDKYIIGQNEAKKKVAIALRNRYRRSKLPEDLQDEISPKNIIMEGPTGVGKTEIARRLAKIVEAPFAKVEATKFTEVGYVGRDVESMIRDLVEASFQMIQKEKIEGNREKAEKLANDKLIDLVYPKKTKGKINPFEHIFSPNNMQKTEPIVEDKEFVEQREIIKEKLKRMELEDKEIEIEIKEKSPDMMGMFSTMGMDDVGSGMNDMLSKIMPAKTKKRKVTISEARKILIEQEAENLLDMDQIKEEAIKKAENYGIVFIDEIDKIISSSGSNGPDVSREGVQRDILPIVEGNIVKTKYGNVNTRHILFIAAGAFHLRKPSELIPELQGRFPIQVRLNSLTKEDFAKILTETKNSLVIQYVELLRADGVEIKFSEEALVKIAEMAYTANLELENIGARRLHSVIEKLVEEISFNAPYDSQKEVLIDENYVEEKLKFISKKNNIDGYIL